MTNLILIAFLKFIFGIIPGMTPELSWTMTTLTYNIVRTTSVFSIGFICVPLEAGCTTFTRHIGSHGSPFGPAPCVLSAPFKKAVVSILVG
jgi:hypothetical protein